MKTSLFKTLVGLLTLVVVLIFNTSCASCKCKLPNLAGEWQMGGPYNVGKVCRIIQEKDALTFINENRNASRGAFKSGTEVIATDWESGLTGVLTCDARRISWRNGTWWTRGGAR